MPALPSLSPSAPLSTPPSTVSPQQTRQNLEALLNSLTEGWSCYRPQPLVGPPPTTSYGQGGGCLHQQICKIAKTLPERKAMEQALGFQRAIDIFFWNDYEASWTAVQELVKDAIGKL